MWRRSRATWSDSTPRSAGSRPASWALRSPGPARLAGEPSRKNAACRRTDGPGTLVGGRAPHCPRWPSVAPWAFWPCALPQAATPWSVTSGDSVQHPSAPPAPTRRADARPDLALAGGGRCGCHGTAATAAGPGGGAARGGPGRAARPVTPNVGACPPRPWRANVRSWRRRLWGGWSSQASTRPAASDSGSREPRRPARRRVWDGQRVSPVVPPAGAEVVPAGTADRGDALGGVSAVSVPDCGGSP